LMEALFKMLMNAEYTQNIKLLKVLYNFN
jgi:hypothetical protein